MADEIREGRLEDAPALAAIYNHYIVHTIITFEEVPIPNGEMERRMREVTDEMDLPWIVGERDRRVAGFAYAHPWQTRSAYRHSVESSIYLHPDATGTGLGTRLYADLIERLEQRPFHRLIGGISLPNEASVALHKRLGFTHCATFPEVGWKLGRWVDVGYWSRPLAGTDQTPPFQTAEATR